ncbi:unnamed protein product, partial [Amoebophrya sp. A25]|eukprot:GSA25T00019656001.1
MGRRGILPDRPPVNQPYIERNFRDGGILRYVLHGDSWRVWVPHSLGRANLEYLDAQVQFAPKKNGPVAKLANGEDAPIVASASNCRNVTRRLLRKTYMADAARREQVVKDQEMNKLKAPRFPYDVDAVPMDFFWGEYLPARAAQAGSRGVRNSRQLTKMQRMKITRAERYGEKVRKLVPWVVGFLSFVDTSELFIDTEENQMFLDSIEAEEAIVEMWAAMEVETFD